MALVGAFVLADALLAGPVGAGAAYEARLRPWVERVQRLAEDPTDLVATATAFTL